MGATSAKRHQDADGDTIKRAEQLRILPPAEPGG